MVLAEKLSPGMFYMFRVPSPVRMKVELKINGFPGTLVLRLTPKLGGFFFFQLLCEDLLSFQVSRL